MRHSLNLESLFHLNMSRFSHDANKGFFNVILQKMYKITRQKRRRHSSLKSHMLHSFNFNKLLPCRGSQKRRGKHSWALCQPNEQFPTQASSLQVTLCSHVDCVDVYWGCRLVYSPRLIPCQLIIAPRYQLHQKVTLAAFERKI